MGAPLEDARHLAQRYDRMRQEAEAQVFIGYNILLINWIFLFVLILEEYILGLCYIVSNN